jgi:carbonic anhydrase
MSRHRRSLLLLALFLCLPLAALALSERLEFLAGGALINAGYRLQDHLHRFDFRHLDDISPEEIWHEFLVQNRLASSVRERFPRAIHHAHVVLVVCMDARIDTNELVGDTRKYYYVIRTAGSVLSEREEEMLELAVANGVKLVVLTTHSDCAAERMAADPSLRARYPNLASAVDERERRDAELLARPAIASRIAAGQLRVRRARIDTASEKLIPAP